MMKNLSILLVFVLIASFTQVLVAQEMDISKFYGPDPVNNQSQATDNLNNSVDPLLDMFGFLTGGGLYNTADVHSILGFDVGIKLTAMQVGDDQTPFLPGLDAEYQEGPLGDNNIVPLPMLHASLGLIGNIEVMGRFFSYPMGEEGSAEGNITLIGVGAKYGLLQVMGLPKIALVGAYHYLTTPDDFHFGDVNNISAAVVVSYSIPTFTFYGGAGIDYTKLSIDLPDPWPDPDPMNKQNFRGNVGLKFSPPLLPIFVNADYNFGAIKGFSAGLGITLR